MVLLKQSEFSLDKYVSICPISRFIEKLDKDDNLSRFSPEVNLELLGQSQREIIKKVASMLDRNYNYINIYEEYLKEPFCKYLNYWLDIKKNNYVSNEFDINDDIWQNIEKLWINLQKTSTPFKCKRNTDKKPLEHQKNRMHLMVYCVNRDEFKRKCNLTSGSTSHKYCLALTEYIKKNYTELVGKNPCLKYKDRNQDYELHFDEKCTLYDIPKTFPDYNTEGGTLSENPITRSPLPYCESTQKAKENFQGPPEEDTVSLVEEPSSPYSAPWNSMTYSGLTVFGILFSSMFLYKYTSFGSFIRSLMIKKNKVRQYINEQAENELLETSSDGIVYNLDNDEYNFSYQPLQN
ncbi:PIR Superfamily Protein [Plasmodium ovale wallikeri]|uniref:PIR Superfamily Protein n=2 Tax=Plasmodium ovale TaxID=36330 RepID=A0A1A9AK40_PLAOA|nr:PIR Superfamily Protein [Plasmodium ovale wallikeri]SBT56983.1 PIR Superfamily Protein [Plasmodium ovale wallikeri]SBT73641.1 PIR protein [Plasmodium ovale]